MKSQTASAAIAALIAHAAAAPTTISASAFVGSATADVYPPSGSMLGDEDGGRYRGANLDFSLG
jgi:hypothetical protein